MSNRFKEICDPLHSKAQQLKFPSFPPEYIPKLEIKGTSTNVLTKQIITFIQLHGWASERISSTGQARTEKIKMASGYTKEKTTWVHGTSRKGTADISATIDGRSVKIEVKNAKTKDRMSKAQESYQDEIDFSGGIYYIARDIDSFIEWFCENFKIHPKWEQAVLKTYKK